MYNGNKMMQTQKIRLTPSGFTIVELLIVIVVIAILATISIVAYSGIQARAKTSSGQMTASNIIKKIESYRAVHGVFPTYAELKNNYSPGSTTAGSGGSEVRLDNPNAIVSAGLSASAATNGTVVQYNDCTTSDPNRSIVYWNYQTNAPVSAKTFAVC